MTNTEKRDKLHKWLFQLWSKRDGGKGYITCFETGQKLKSEKFQFNLSCYSHLLPKNTFPQYAQLEENIVIVHPDAHYNFTVAPEKAPKQLNAKRLLMKKHKEGKLKD